MVLTDTQQQALQKLKAYCAYSERCHKEVADKLYGLQVYGDDRDAVIAVLIQENYLNEERYAQAFAGGHFRHRQWGRNKIKQALLQKNISPYCIKKGLAAIDGTEYHATLQKLMDAKWAALKGEKNRFIKMRKATDYLLQKGYEPALVQDLLKDKTGQ